MDESTSPSTAALRVPCPHCHKVIKVPPAYLGRTAKCPGCGTTIVLQLPTETTMEVPEPPPILATPSDSITSTPASPRPVADAKSTRMARASAMFWLGLLVVGVVVGLVATGGVSSFFDSGRDPVSPAESSPPAVVDNSEHEDSPRTTPADSVVAVPQAVSRAPVSKFTSPEACYEAFKEAVKQDDHATMLACMVERERDIYVGMTAYHLQREAFMGLAVKKRAEIERMFEAQGIGGIDIMGALQMAGGPFGNMGDERIMSVFEQVGGKVRDQGEFMTQVVALYEQLKTQVAVADGVPAEETLPVETLPVEAADQAIGELRDVVIDGDTATAELRMESGPRMPLDFSRVNGSWLLGQPVAPTKPRAPRRPPPTVATEKPRPEEPLIVEEVEKLPLTGDQEFAVKTLEQYGNFSRMTRWPSEQDGDGGPTFTLLNPDITDSQISMFMRLPFLESIDLQNARRLSDAGFGRLTTIPRLRNLDLSNSSLNDMGVRGFRLFRSLEELRVANTQVSDKIFNLADQLPRLKLLDVTNTRVTQKVVDQFRARHPKCTVVFADEAAR